jgi:PAS domain S-box-containing protein
MTESEIAELIPTWVLHSKQYSLVITDFDGRYIFVNEVFKKRFSFIADDFIGLYSQTTFHQNDFDKCEEAVMQCLQYPDSIATVQLRKPESQTEDYYWTSWEFSLFKDKKNEPVGILCLGHDITDTERADKLLKDSVERIETVMENITDGFFILGRTYRFAKVNKMAEQILGLSREDLLGKRVWAAFPDSPEYNYATQFSKAMREGVTVRFEDYYPDSELWISTTAYPSIEGLTVFFRDITERRKAQEHLRQSENKLRAILDCTTDNYILISPDMRIIGFNKTVDENMRKFWHRTMQEGDNFSAYIPQAYLTDFEVKFEQAKNGAYIVRERLINGTWFLVQYYPVYDDMRTLIGVAFVSTDIHSRKTAEEKLLQSEYMLNAIYNSTSEASTFIDRDFKIQYNNQVAKAICREVFGREAKIGDYSLDFMLPELRGKFLNYYQRVLQGETIETEETDGQRWWLFSLFPVYDTAHNIVGIADNVQDITLRKQYELQLLTLKNDLQRKNQLLNAIFESPKGIIIFSLDKEYRYLTYTKTHKDVMKQIWGVDIAIGCSMPEYITLPTDRIRAKDNFDKALSGAYFVMAEEYGDEILRRTYWENRYSPMLDDTNKIIGLTVFVTDITEQKKAELTLKENEKRLDALADNFPDGSISLIDFDLQILYTGGTGYKRYQINPKTLIGKPLKDVLTPENYANVERVLPELLKGEVCTYETDFEGDTYLNTLQPVRDENRLINSFVLASINITQRKQNEQKIINQNKALRDIAWNQSHTVRRPVANILGLVNLIQTEKEEGGEFDLQYILHLTKATQELDQIIHDIVSKANEYEEESL